MGFEETVEVLSLVRFRDGRATIGPELPVAPACISTGVGKEGRERIGRILALGAVDGGARERCWLVADDDGVALVATGVDITMAGHDAGLSARKRIVPGLI